MTDQTTAEQAREIIAQRSDAIRRDAGRGKTCIELRRRIAAAGTLSNGTRFVYIETCERARYLIARTGDGTTVHDIDQRDHWGNPQRMADLMLMQLERLEIMAGNRATGAQQAELAL